MTKRVLSMLMALIMALSLCVPAFAADEPVSADEPAAEVEAPAAEAEETEAEAEPVDEPAEVAVDEPEAVANGEVSAYAKEYLNYAMEQAKSYKAQVDAGELYVEGEFKAINDETRTDKFDKAYAEAERNQKGIAGEETGADVTDTSVQKAAKDLLDLLPEDVAAGTSGKLTNQVTQTMKDAVTTKLGQSIATPAGSTGSDLSSITSKSPEAAIDALSASHSDALVAAVKAAVAAAKAFEEIKKPVYSDYLKVEKLALAVVDIIKNEKLTAEDAKTLQAAIDAVKAAQKDGSIKNYVGGQAGGNLTKDEKTEGPLKTAVELLNPTGVGVGKNGFVDSATYATYRAALAALKLVPIDMDVKLTLTLKKKDGKITAVTAKLEKDTNNTTEYYYTYDVNGTLFWNGADVNYNDKAADPVKFDGASQEVKPLHAVKENTDDVTAFKASDKVTVTISTKDAHGRFTPVITESITMPADGYAGPTIAVDEDTGEALVKVTYGSEEAAAKLGVDTDSPLAAPKSASEGTKGIEVEVTLTAEEMDGTVGDNWDLVALSGKTVVGKAESVETSKGTITIDESKLTGSTLRIELRVKTDEGGEAQWHEGCDATVTLDALSAWDDVEDANAVIEAAEALVKADYELDESKLASLKQMDIETYDQAWDLLQARLKDIKDIVANADSEVNSKTERKALITAVTDLTTVFGYLKTAAADKTAYYEAVDAAAEISDTYSNNEDENGEHVFTYASWKAFSDAYTKYKAETFDKSPYPSQSQYDAAAKALNEAVAGLKEVDGTDATELESVIAEAEALKEEDYTEESWADADLANAIADAKEVLADQTSTQDELDAAVEALKAAMAKLVPAEEPTEPELKEGWNLVEGEYYYCKDGKMVKSDWVKSKGLWYHMGADGTMDTGFIHIVDDWGDGWYYLEPSNAKGTEGRMRTGWQDIDDASAGPYGWFETRSNGHQGQCTYTKGWGDFDGYIKK